VVANLESHCGATMEWDAVMPDWTPSVGDRVRITRLLTSQFAKVTGVVPVDGLVVARVSYLGGGWSITVLTDAMERMGLTNDDVLSGRMRIEPL
jgi:hypothetical protein